jgi:FtsZ-interacting cell division protein ZipA
VSLKGALLADLRQERAMIDYTKRLQNSEGQFAQSAAEQKEMAQASKARTAQVKPMEKEKKDILSQLESFKKVLVARTKDLNQSKQKRHRGDFPIKNGLEKLLAILGIDQAAYHEGDLNGKNLQQMFQESDQFFSQFKELLLGVDAEDG